ncbi:50S ribosomal protein L9 [Chloroflexota bacterium]
MRVIFLEDVSKVANAGDIKEVADGYGRNFLIPKKLAVLANAPEANLVEVQNRIKAKREAKSRDELTELAQKLDGKEIIIKGRAGANKRLHGSITNADIADELQNRDSLIVDKRKIELDEPIHQLGSYEVTVKLASDIAPKIMVTVIEEEETEQSE